MIHEILKQIVAERTAGEKSVAVLLSGGVDSLSCAFAAEDCGLEVHGYTFQCGEWSSSDAKAAQAACKAFGWGFTLVKTPVDTDTLATDFLRLARDYACVKKTQFDCTWPFLYLIPAITERVVLSGIAADGHYCLSKRGMIHYKEPQSRFQEFRAQYFAQENPAGQVQQKWLLEQHGKEQIAPYLDRRVFDFFSPFSWSDCNKPKQKVHVLRAYKGRFDIVGRREHANLQLVAGVDIFFASLLGHAINVKKRKRVLDLCRDYAVSKSKDSASEREEED